MVDAEHLAHSLRPHYSDFLKSSEGRILMSGHSHQAWPNCAKDGLLESYQSASQWVDHKHTESFKKEQILIQYLKKYYQDPLAHFTFDSNTHNLLIRWLSALDLKNSPWIISSSVEFYTVARQLRRLEDVDIHVDYLDPLDRSNFLAQLKLLIPKKPAALILSQVFYKHGLLNVDLLEIYKLAAQHDVPFLIDVYHGTHVHPLNLGQDFPGAYVIGGGYKYLQWGEGNAFLRYPDKCHLKPMITGWFADFANIEAGSKTGPMNFPIETLFAGATQDPSSRFRAARVAQFFTEQQLNATTLQSVYKFRVNELRQKFLELNISNEKVKPFHPDQSEVGGFLALKSPRASTLSSELNKAGVWCDCRENVLRLGPAPYTLSDDINQALKTLKQIVDGLHWS